MIEMANMGEETDLLWGTNQSVVDVVLLQSLQEVHALTVEASMSICYEGWVEGSQRWPILPGEYATRMEWAEWHGRTHMQYSGSRRTVQFATPAHDTTKTWCLPDWKLTAREFFFCCLSLSATTIWYWCIKYARQNIWETSLRDCCK